MRIGFGEVEKIKVAKTRLYLGAFDGVGRRGR